MENNEPITDKAEEPQEVQPSPSGSRKDKLAAWIQFPRRMVFLLAAFGLAHALIFALRGPMAAAATRDPTIQEGQVAAIEESLRSGNLVSVSGRPVAEMVAEYLPNTLTLLGAALALALILAAVATLIAILAHWLEERFGPIGSILKGLGRLLAFGPASLPVFCMGIVLIFVFAFQLGWLPVVGMVEPPSPEDLGARIRHLILPMLTLTILPAVLTAQAVSRDLTRPDRKGRKRLLLVGVFGTLGTLLGQIGGWLSASILVEEVFAWPGIGRLLFASALRRDFPLFLGILATYPILILVGRLLAELFRWLARLVEGSAPEPQSQEELAPSRWRKAARAIWTAVGLALLLAPLLVAAAGMVVNEDAVMASDPVHRLEPPSIEHPLGTDTLGRDVFALALRGTSMELGTAGLAAGIVFLPSLIGGALLGFLASRRTWWVDLIADLLLLPADALLFIPLIPSGIMWCLLLIGRRDQPGVLVTLALVVVIVLLPRVVRLYPPLWEAAPERRKWLRIALAGPGAILLGSLFAGLWLVTALDFLGVGFWPPTPTLGREIQELRVGLMQGQAGLSVIAVLWVCAFALYTAADALVGFFWTKEALVHLNE